MKIIFDLDGTLICSKKRLYELFCNLIQSRDLSFSDYWNLKYIGNSNQDILRERFDYTKAEISNFVNGWMKKIESDYYLEMDTLIDGTIEFLERIIQNNSLYICTARQSTCQVAKQLESLSISKYFENIFVTEQKNSKAELLKNSGLKFTKHDWIIGDTGHDIITGKEIGINTCAVLSGFMSLDALIGYSPDIIVANIAKIDFI
ncbi:HAD hydrolase-like protein [Acinetobacter johnsonii]|jgi:phosphoglycolate phosphatase|uniref:HAD family hydrolase n=1 Tax=Acinetobacter johnsonii TaxID=40214 RepID=UPI0013220147|nr:HAD hydrolase-like protein [Acinetobacter johnsonii]MWC19335.1 HAD hydrolase-like protein [Acinetobacter johnsonii]